MAFNQANNSCLFLSIIFHHGFRQLPYNRFVYKSGISFFIMFHFHLVGSPNIPILELTYGLSDYSQKEKFRLHRDK